MHQCDEAPLPQLWNVCPGAWEPQLLKHMDPRAHSLQQKKPLPSCSNEDPARPKLSHLINLFLEDAF